jgi:DNA repair protein SbcC/Rad50
MEYRGSKWRKWDLHVHTLHSHTNSKYHCTMKEIATKISKEKISVVGVTNYFIVEEKEILELQEELAKLNCEIYIIPNFEFRINEKNKDSEYINIHVLFNPNTTTIKNIHASLARIELTNIASETKVYCTLENVKKIGSEKITIAFIDLVEQLNKDFKAVEDFLIIGVNKGYGGFCPGGKPRDKELAEKIDTMSDFIFSRKDDVDFYLNKVTGRDKLKLPPKAVVECSDAHTINDIGSKFSWIKADKTFEGLKQIVYEPGYRIFIGEQKPVPPPRKIDTLQIDFPSDTLIIRSDEKTDNDKSADFCLRGSRKINFSPFFTCLIGGRGAGKSTILNIIAQKLGHNGSFFEKNSLLSLLGTENLKEIEDIQDFIKIEGTEEIEYISQNEIEDFAEDKEKLTNAIYNRLPNQNSEIDFKSYEIKIEKNISEINKQLRDVNATHEKTVALKNIEISLSNDQKIVSSFDNPTYAALTSEINKVGEAIEKINIAKLKYLQLITSITNLVEKYDFQVAEQNSIEKEITKVVKDLKKVLVDKFDISITDTDLDNLTKKQLDVSNQLEEYLKSQGLSQENINDYERAAKAIPQYKTAINNLNTEITEIKKSLQIFDNSRKTFFQDKESLERLIHENLEPLNRNLKSKNSNVKDISFRYEFDNEKAKESLFNEFWSYFENKRPKDFGLKSPQDAVNRLLFENEPIDVLNQSKSEFIARYEMKVKSIQSETQAKQYLLKFFEDDVNFEIYQLLILRVFTNPLKYKGITGFYDNRQLKNCSFGQRCTAVIVALLTFGNKPLIIDEPEAHLDSKLIAEYLVGLVKDKKQERQIIFATHNANFVINGDAELILHLEIGDNNETIITPISIENVKHREKLLLLEGGEEAFRKRDKRLIKN